MNHRLLVIAGFVATLSLMAPSCSCEDDVHNQFQIGEEFVEDDAGDGDDGGFEDVDADDQDSSPDDPVVLPDLDDLDGERIDFLWVIDNSATMCRVQRSLDKGIERFLDILEVVNLDVHLAVTTTEMSADPASSVAAVGGRLQTTPQPLPGFDAPCHYPLDQNGLPIVEDLSPVRNLLDLSIQCTEDPSAWEGLLEVSDHQLRCAVDTTYSHECDDEERVGIADYFPPTGRCDREDGQCEGQSGVTCQFDQDCTSSFRERSPVLRTNDFQTEWGTLDRPALAREFRCLSLVGTRGSEFRQGLGAAVSAVSPELTGGPGTAVGDAPNAGFLRDDALLSVVFVSSGNDCSHDGTLDEESPCGVDQCVVQETLGADGALLNVDELHHDFLRNAGVSRGWIPEDTEVLPEEWKQALASTVIPISIHGPIQRDIELSPEECTQPGLVAPACRTAFGSAWSGHRYADFLEGFPDSIPQGFGGGQVGGEICHPVAEVFEESGLLWGQ